MYSKIWVEQNNNNNKIIPVVRNITDLKVRVSSTDHSLLIPQQINIYNKKKELINEVLSPNFITKYRNNLLNVSLLKFQHKTIDLLVSFT